MNIHPLVHDELITKYFNGEATPDEAILIEEWKSLSADNQLHFEGMQATFLLLSKQKWASPNKETAWQELNKKRKVQYKLTWLYGIAAITILGLMVALFLLNSDITLEEMVAVDRPVIRQLSDQSSVTLQSHSKIIFSEGFGKSNRTLHLSGKADFNVMHNERLPFVIEADGVFIEDLGTVFSVENLPGSDTVFVVVQGGIVRLYDEDGSEITIKAGEKAWYIRSQKKIITDIGTKVIKFDFKDTPLAEVVDLLEKTYQTDITLIPESIGQCRITTQFFDEEIATIMTILTETLDFKYEYQNHHFKINGKSCQ